MSDLIPIGRALLSVSDKTGLDGLARALAGRGVELVSTGGTAAALKAAGCAVRDVSDVTGWPEMLDGRVKTLHPKVHGGLLAIRDDAGHTRQTAEHAIAPIDLLIVNLYPFEATAAADADFARCIENIDIGGPAMIRSAAKNHADVAVIVDPDDYQGLLAELEANGGATNLAFRRRLAAKAFARTAGYDAAIAEWFAGQPDETPRWRTFGGVLAQALRYGENPHQRAALYRSAGARPGVANAVQHQGKELSYNNIADADAAFELASEFAPGEAAAVAIIKHANPCGVAVAPALAEAYRRAFAADETSAFGGVVALNREIDAETAREIVKVFTEVVIAPGVTDEAKAILAAKANVRVLATGTMADADAGGDVVKSVSGGLLVQSRDDGGLMDEALRVVTKRQPTAREWADLRFAWRVCKHVKSNAIVFARDGATAGIGAGQMSRVDAVRIGAGKAAEKAAKTSGSAQGSALSAPTGESPPPLWGRVREGGGIDAPPSGFPPPLTPPHKGEGDPVEVGAGDQTQAPGGFAVASDAFFPFADGLIAAAEAGATAVIQPGGSMRDAEVVAAADERGLAMVFTSMRHFRH